MSINQQATYLQGQDIVIDVTLTAHHKGHFEFAVCAIAEGEKPTTGERELEKFKKCALLTSRVVVITKIDSTNQISPFITCNAYRML